MAASRSVVSYVLIISIVCLILLLYCQYKSLTKEDEKPNPLSIVGLSIGEMFFSAVITFTTLILI